MQRHAVSYNIASITAGQERWSVWRLRVYYIPVHQYWPLVDRISFQGRSERASEGGRSARLKREQTSVYSDSITISPSDIFRVTPAYTRHVSINKACFMARVIFRELVIRCIQASHLSIASIFPSIAFSRGVFWFWFSTNIYCIFVLLQPRFPQILESRWIPWNLIDHPSSIRLISRSYSRNFSNR